MHWRNSFFQISSFIAGKANTPDEAKRVLLELREERDVAIKASEASEMRSEAKRLRIDDIINDEESTEADILDAKADLVEMSAFEEQGKACFEEALRERDFIDTLLSEVEQHCKYNHLPLHEANQITQQKEWELELVFRAQNFIASQGSIPHDHLATMRMHPSWDTVLLPAVQKITALIRQDDPAAIPTKALPFPELANHMQLTHEPEDTSASTVDFTPDAEVSEKSSES